MSEAFLAEFWELAHRMARGVKYPQDGLGWAGVGMHPVVKARQDAFHFRFRKPFPDKTGQSVKQELVDFLALCEPIAEGRFKGFFVLTVDGVRIRVEVSDMIQYEPKQIWFAGGRMQEGCYIWLQGIQIRCWGLDGAMRDY